jgi:hypothetical protein
MSAESSIRHPINWRESMMRDDLRVLELHNLPLSAIVSLPDEQNTTLQQAFQQQAQSTADLPSLELDYDCFYASLAIELNDDHGQECAIASLCHGWLETINRHNGLTQYCSE